MSARTTCSASSHASGEHLYATAARADTWFLLEYPHAHGAKALEESSLPVAVIDHLQSAAAVIPNSRIQLIKQESRSPESPLRFFAAVNHEEQPNLYEFKLQRPEDLLDLDLQAIARESRTHRVHDRKDPIFLVCTNGRRDPCCASLGLPLYRSLTAAHGDAVWQADHVGGHRFAPNLVVLPAGMYYGYLSRESASQVVKTSLAGRVHLANYRGRSCYAAHIQAAETLLRRTTGRTDTLAFRLEEVNPVDENAWMCRFSDRSRKSTYCVQVRREPAAIQVQKSCREPNATPVAQYWLEDYQEFKPT